MFRRIRLGFVVIDKLSFFGFSKIVATLITESTLCVINLAAGWAAYKIQFSAALLTEFGPFTVLKLAFRALHF
jgi:hypothetical protein